MDSSVPISRSLRDRTLPFVATLQEDLRQTLRHWAFAAWAVLATLVTVIWLLAPGRLGSSDSPPATANPAGATVSAAPGDLPTASRFTTKLLEFHLLFLATFIVALGAGSIAAEADIAADAILCRGISRRQYYLGKCLARMLAVTGLFLLLTAPAIALATFRFDNDLTWRGISDSLRGGATMSAAIAALGVSASIWFRNPLVAVASAWMALYGCGIVVSALDVSTISPVGYVARLPDLLRGADALPPHHLATALGIAALGATIASVTCYSVKDV